MAASGSKFRMKVKLQGFELEIEGAREDASLIGRNIGDQISAMLSPAVNIVDGDVASTNSPIAPPVATLIDHSSKKKSSRRVKQSAAANGAETPNIEFRHDPIKYGMPTQQWNTAQKAIWLLYVVKEIVGTNEMSTGQIFKTFNTQFRQAKTITNSNISRDLGKAKIANPALVGEDTTKSPSAWFLTDEGVKRAQALIMESLKPQVS